MSLLLYVSHYCNSDLGLRFLVACNIGLAHTGVARIADSEVCVLGSPVIAFGSHGAA